tara:strand:+ start:101 stop:514 length:414 start_codon:yes stop_codon:yes gene_type:complete
MGNTKPIGVAYEDQDIIGADQIYSSGELGYTAVAQSTVTQATDKSTGVTLNKSAGQITMNAAALGATTNVAFVLTNSLLSAKDVVIVNVAGGTAATTSYNCWVSGHAAGSVTIVLRNITAGSLSEAVVLNFAVIHCM